MPDLRQAKPGTVVVLRDGQTATIRSITELGLGYFCEPRPVCSSYTVGNFYTATGKQYSGSMEHPCDIVKIGTARSKYPTNRKAHGS